ncbi:APC family permease [Thermoflavimicrobium dichotomicum]|uniref:Basic amino acid/polyamine antiporter, APA family n=1 Tax=Thermoflavimicrobium dichotomicum TaxID=46223 RepID=A0A1I3JMG3_9BACL|nr:amino acid permease [Thermoflavimicrobium dichotomicum]SFI61075.1 basic amino acid/polyamine antiporter, APA family [Thermoflavimicrobium dichotomicum]
MKKISENQLKRDLGFWPTLSLVIGVVIGSGVFVKPGTVLGYVGGNTNLALLAWLLGGILTLAAGLTIAELSAQIPKTGGLYVYLEETYGKLWGYLSGWMQSIVYQPALIGAMGLYFGSLVAHFFFLDPSWGLWIGLSAVLFLAIINSLGVKYGGVIQVITTATKLLPILLIAVFGLWKGNSQIFFSPSGMETEWNLGAAMLATLFAYDGWIAAASVAGEMKNPSKVLPRAIFTGLIIVMIAYLSVNLALLKVLPAIKIQTLGENAASTASGILFGEIGGKLLSIGIIVSIFGGLNGKILSFPRIPYAMAVRNQLPGSRWLARVHPRFGTPIIAIAFQIALAILYMCISNPDWLSEISIFAVFLFYIQAFIAVILLRKRNQAQTPSYRVPLYPITPIVAILGSLFVVISTIIHDPTGTWIALGIILLGIPVYAWIQRRTKQLAKASS